MRFLNCIGIFDYSPYISVMSFLNQAAFQTVRKGYVKILPVFFFICHGFICIFPGKFTFFFIPEKQPPVCFFYQEGIFQAAFLKERLGYADSSWIFNGDCSLNVQPVGFVTLVITSKPDVKFSSYHPNHHRAIGDGWKNHSQSVWVISRARSPLPFFNKINGRRVGAEIFWSRSGEQIWRIWMQWSIFLVFERIFCCWISWTG